VIMAVTMMSGTATITAPGASSGHPVWNQIGTTQVVNADFEQALYWHEIGSAEVGTPQFTFTFGPGTPIIRASCGAILYTNTCLMSGVPCTDPTFDSNLGTSTNANGVSQTQTSSPQGETLGQIDVPALGLVVGAFGTSDQNSFFGDSATSGSNINGTLGVMSQHTQSSGVNGGIVLGDKSVVSGGVVGPFPATLPNRVDPSSQSVVNIVGNGATATGTTNAGDIRQYGRVTLTAVISGNTVGAFNGTFTITPTSATTFTFSSATNATGTGGSIQPEDPAVGDNISQTVSLKPVLK
jgi:hypothetical protein